MISASPPTRRGSERGLGGRFVGSTTPTRPLPRPTSPRGGDSYAVSVKVWGGRTRRMNRVSAGKGKCLASQRTFPVDDRIAKIAVPLVEGITCSTFMFLASYCSR